MPCPGSIVIIEDDEDIREAMHALLELEGFPVTSFANGKEAIDALKEYSEPCLILLDLMMPIMNGWEFLKARKALGDTIVAIPVYIVSAIANQLEAEETGASGYIKKPVDAEILVKIVKGYCEKPKKVA
jgi:CheY-like chemotaxis protein